MVKNDFINSDIDNKYFSYTIKNKEDIPMLYTILEKVCKSFSNLEKSFENFLIYGKCDFIISKHLILNADKAFGKDKDRINYTIETDIDFKGNESYTRYKHFEEKEIGYIEKLIDSNKSFMEVVKDQVIIESLNTNNKYLNTKLEVLKNDIEENDIIQDVFKEFEDKVFDLFLSAVVINSGNIFNKESLKDKVSISMFKESDINIRKDFDNRVERSRNNFIKSNKDKIEDLIECEICEDNVCEDIIDPDEFFAPKIEILKDLAKKGYDA